MRKRVIAGNWKMYKTKDEAISFIYEVAKVIPDRDLVETVICAPSIMLRDLVKREDVIGLVGNTGRSTGPHLHYEIRYKNRSLDPRQYLKK